MLYWFQGLYISLIIVWQSCHNNSSIYNHKLISPINTTHKLLIIYKIRGALTFNMTTMFFSPQYCASTRNFPTWMALRKYRARLSTQEQAKSGPLDRLLQCPRLAYRWLDNYFSFSVDGKLHKNLLAYFYTNARRLNWRVIHGALPWNCIHHLCNEDLMLVEGIGKIIYV